VRQDASTVTAKIEAIKLEMDKVKNQMMT